MPQIHLAQSTDSTLAVTVEGLEPSTEYTVTVTEASASVSLTASTAETPAPEPEPEPEVTYEDAQGASFTSGEGITSRYHLYASHLSGDAPKGILIHLHGDGGSEYNTPTAPTVQAYRQVAVDNDLIFVVPRTPDTSTMTWWSTRSNARWVVDLLGSLGDELPIDLENVWWSGYSGGAEVLSYFILDEATDRWHGGGVLMVAGGGASGKTRLTVQPTADFKSTVPLTWLVGALDSPEQGGDDGGFDALAASAGGRTFYSGQGFAATRTVLPGLDHYQTAAHGPAALRQMIEGAADAANEAPAKGDWIRLGGETHEVSGVNAYRDVDHLTVYTHESGHPTSPANQWGIEAAINSQGVITEIRAYGAGLAIPEGGYVLSGHGEAGYWLEARAVLGASVEVVEAPEVPAPAEPAGRVLAAYAPGWGGTLDFDSLSPHYNLIYPFAAHRDTSGPYGAVRWGYPRPLNLQAARQRGVKVIFSTGGAGSGINFSSRAVSQAFINSVVAAYDQWGGFDGVDFNTFEAEALPNDTEYLWMFSELKRRYGQDFMITSPPAPWKDVDKSMIRKALSQGLMDYAAPQYYDGPGLAVPSYITNSVDDWVANVAGGDASKIVVGFGYQPGAANYSSVSDITSAWSTIAQRHPGIRGAFLWSAPADRDNGWPVASALSSLVL